MGEIGGGNLENRWYVWEIGVIWGYKEGVLGFWGVQNVREGI